MNIHLIMYYIGIVLLFASNIVALTGQWRFSISLASINIVAGLCIAYYFMYREGYIRF